MRSSLGSNLHMSTYTRARALLADQADADGSGGIDFDEVMVARCSF